MATPRARPQAIRLTDAAAERIKYVMANAVQPIVGVRVGVKNGGCAGMTYTMEYAERIEAADEVVEDKGLRVRTGRGAPHVRWRRHLRRGQDVRADVRRRHLSQSRCAQRSRLRARAARTLHLCDQDGPARGDVLPAHAGPPLRRPGRTRDLGARCACGGRPRRGGEDAREDPQKTKLTRDVMPALRPRGRKGRASASACQALARTGRNRKAGKCPPAPSSAWAGLPARRGRTWSSRVSGAGALSGRAGRSCLCSRWPPLRWSRLWRAPLGDASLSGLPLWRSPVSVRSRSVRSLRDACGPLSIHGMVWPISFSIAATFLPSAGATMVMAVPLRPARPVRPMRWT